MANFVHNVASGENYYSQWKRYIQQTEHISDITSAIKSQSKSYETQIKQASEIVSSSLDEVSRRQVEAIADAAGMIVGRLDQGFSDLSEGLFDVERSVDRLATMLDWRLSQLVDQQRISNVLLGNIAQLLRIPDVQKERQYFIEQGFKHYKNAVLDSDLYENALENLLEAEKRERTDYVVLHRIGMISLYSTKMLDLPKAEDYLRRAAKYAVVESDPNAQRIFNILLGDLSKPLLEQSIPPDAPKMIAAESYLQAGIACYAQGKFADAIALSGKAFSMLPTMLEAGFMKAKAIAANGGDAEAAELLEDIIKAERFYSVKTATDGDLAPKSTVQALLAQLTSTLLSKQRKESKSVGRVCFQTVKRCLLSIKSRSLLKGIRIFIPSKH